jgi:single-stranded-DNA-specific exonuclease
MSHLYTVRPPVPDNIRKDLIQYSDIVAHLLYHRGIQTSDDAYRFINPDYKRDLGNPFLLKNIDIAVERIVRAIKNNEKIVIYSDYDTDGIPGAVAMHDFFKKIGVKNFSVYIPHRHDEGFGLNMDAVESFANDGVDLVITIDCGIADIAPAQRAKELGVDLIITDHHMPGEELPDAYTIVNPKQDGCEYPEKMLCGAGVAFKLIQAIIEKGRKDGDIEIKPEWEKWLLDMVGIATLSDMVPLTGENRAFAHYGLIVLRKSPRPGLSKLLSIVGTSQKYLTEDDIGFTIGPRINAASRMGVPYDAFVLLSTSDEAEADTYARALDKTNNERKGKVASMAKEAKHILSGRNSLENRNVIVIGNPDWRPALLGLLANTCAEEYGKPFFVWGRDGDGVIKGSCRAAGMVNLVDLMSKVPENVFIQYGGHSASGGFSVTTEGIFSLEDHLCVAYDECISKKNDGPAYTVDMELPIESVNWNTFDDIKTLAPFGVGNHKPLFAFPNVSLLDVKTFGKEGNHLQISLKNNISAIGFFMSPNSFNKKIEKGNTVSLIGNIEKSVFRGRPELRIRIVDIL